MDNFDLRNFLYNNTLLNEDAKEDLEKSYEKDVEGFRKDLSKYINIPKVKAVLAAGLADGDPDDDKLPFTSTKVAVKKLIPTQKEIGFDQSVKGNLDDKFGSLDGILKGNVDVGGPIVTYAGKYIIDGHHRWSTVFAANPGANMDALDIAPKSGFQPLDILKAVHSSIAVDLNKVPSADPKGKNILDGSIKYKDVLAKVKEIFAVTDKGEKVWKSFFEKQNVPYSPESVAKHLYNNLNKIVKNGHISGSPGRKDMPQTDADKTKSIDKLKPLAKGEINITTPFEENKKSLIKNIIKEEILKVLNEQKSK